MSAQPTVPSADTSGSGSGPVKDTPRIDGTSLSPISSGTAPAKPAPPIKGADRAPITSGDGMPEHTTRTKDTGQAPISSGTAPAKPAPPIKGADRAPITSGNGMLEHATRTEGTSLSPISSGDRPAAHTRPINSTGQPPISTGTGTGHEPIEHPLRIDATGPGGAAQPMLGILCRPGTALPPSDTAVLIVVGGAQYRVGSHRQFVLLSRRIAAAGHAVLRFDFPGMGDSPGEALPFEDSAPCIAAAIEALQAQQPGVRRVVLLGLCDGASASLLYLRATQDRRVAGLALLNPWVRNEASLARTQLRHYYRQRLRQASFWRKLLRGAVGWSALRGLGSRLLQVLRQRAAASGQPDAKQVPFQDRMAQAWLGFDGPILLLLSERDLSAQEFVEHARSSPAWSGWARRPGTAAHTLAQADHTCSAPHSAREFEALVLTWLRRWAS